LILRTQQKGGNGDGAARENGEKSEIKAPAGCRIDKKGQRKKKPDVELDIFVRGKKGRSLPAIMLWNERRGKKKKNPPQDWGGQVKSVRVLISQKK